MSQSRVMRWTIFVSKMVHLPQTSIFWEKSLLSSSTYWPISWCQVLKFFYNRPRVIRMCHFWTHNGPICPNQNISQNLLINLVPIIHVYLHYKSDINLLMKYWCLKNPKSHWPRAIFGYNNLRTRFFPGMQFLQNVRGS